jgi:hypothetical protein
MRTHHVIAVVAVILAGVGAKQTFFTAPTAEANWLSSKSVGLDVSQLHQNVNLPVQQFHDMSFVFSAAATSDEPRNGFLAPRCAERDLRASAVIEEFGQTDAMPAAWLAAAGLNWLQARSHCLAGAENKGVDLYDTIIAGETRVPNEQAMNERGRR